MGEYFVWVFAAFIVNGLITSIVHFIAHFWTLKKEGYSNGDLDIFSLILFEKPETIKEGVLYILSLDYWSVSSYKSRHHGADNKDKKSEFIKKSNLLNLILTIGSFVGIVFAMGKIGVADTSHISILLKLILGVRVLSRAVEIIVGFTKDIFDEKKTSSLNSGDRLKLAMTSLLEMTISFAMIYFLFQVSFGIEPVEIPSLKQSVFNSIGVSTLTGVSFYDSNSWLQNLFIVLHLLTSMSLIVLSLAKYISSKESKEEQVNGKK